MNPGMPHALPGITATPCSFVSHSTTASSSSATPGAGTPEGLRPRSLSGPLRPDAVAAAAAEHLSPASGAGQKKKAKPADEEYDVRNFYTDSHLAKIVGSNKFTIITYIMIGSNSIWIGMDADLNPADNLAEAPGFVQVAEIVFGTFFVAEIIMRFFSFRNKFDALKDFWFKFDGTLVVMMLVETFVLPVVFSALDKGGGISKRDFSGVLRTARCLRLFRIVRRAQHKKYKYH